MNRSNLKKLGIMQNLQLMTTFAFFMFVDIVHI